MDIHKFEVFLDLAETMNFTKLLIDNSPPKEIFLNRFFR